MRHGMTAANRRLCQILLITAAAILSRTARAGSEVHPHQPRHRETARWWSLGGSLASVAIAGTGGAMLKYGRIHSGTAFGSSMRRDGAWLIGIGSASSLFTPAFGEWYAGEAITGGMKLRGAGIGVGLIGIAAYFASGRPCQQFGNSCTGGKPHDPVPATVVISIGATAYLAGMIYDVVTAPAAADRYNAGHLQLSPTAILSASGLHPGIGLGATF